MGDTKIIGAAGDLKYPYGVPILYPGAYVFLETLTASSIVGSIVWEEIPL